MSSERRVRLDLVAAGARLAAAGLIGFGEGNLSVRTSTDSCLITPTGTDKARLSAHQLVALSLVDEAAGDRASSEWRVHSAVLRRCERVGSVVHAHPPGIQRLAMRDRVPDCDLLLEGAEAIAGVGWAERLPPGSAELATAVVEAVEVWPACVLAGHGALTVGDTIHDAMRRMMLLERLAVLTAAL